MAPSKSETSSSFPPAIHACAGAVGGALATWMFYPLELLRVEIQAQGKNNNTRTSQEDEENQQQTETSSHAETNLECFIRLYRKQALYRGASSMVTTMLLSSFITFYALEVTRRSMSNIKKQSSQHQHQRTSRQRHHLQNHIKFLNYLLPKSKMGTSLLASTLTGILNVFLTTPLWNGTRRIMESGITDVSSEQALSCKGETQQLILSQLKRRHQQKQPNLWEMMHYIANNEGILQLWHGTWSSLLLVSNPAIQYFLYEQIRVLILGIKNRRDGGGKHASSLQLTPVEAFMFGALSKTVATVVTYPLQLAQVLIRLRKNEINNNVQHTPVTTDDSGMNVKEYNGMLDCLYQQYTHGGFVSLFQGMNSKLLQTVLSAAFTFLTYEQILALFGKVLEHTHK